MESSAEHESGEFGGRAEQGVPRKARPPGFTEQGWPGPSAVTGPDWGGSLEPDRIPSNIETFDFLLFPNITDFQNPPTPILN